MRTHYPLNAKPLFVYPAISIRKYDWSIKPKSERILLQISGWIWFLIVGYLFLVSGSHHLITWSDLSWALVFNILKCVVVLALFPLIVIPVVSLALGKRGLQAENKFFKDWANVFTGYGKGKYSCFFAEDVESMSIQQAYFEKQGFYLVTVIFKPWLLGRRRNEKFGLGVTTVAGLESFLGWIEANQIKIEWEPAEKNQRRS